MHWGVSDFKKFVSSEIGESNRSSFLLPRVDHILRICNKRTTKYFISYSKALFASDCPLTPLSAKSLQASFFVGTSTNHVMFRVEVRVALLRRLTREDVCPQYLEVAVYICTG